MHKRATSKCSNIPEPLTNPPFISELFASLISQLPPRQARTHRNKTASAVSSLRPPTRLLQSSRPSLNFVGGFVRSHTPGSTRRAEGGEICSKDRVVMASWGLSHPDAVGEQPLFNRHPSLLPYPTPVQEKSLGSLGLGEVRGTRQAVEMEMEWNPASASVFPGRVGIIPGASHVLSRQLRGNFRGQAAGQGSRSGSHMLLKAVDARLFGGLGAG